MPKIHLKPNSPEYAEQKRQKEAVRNCQMPGCPGFGNFRAPRDRSLSDHYWFCQDHITEYNQAWNFFDGMNQREVEEHILQSMFGDRPTRRYDADGLAQENLRRQAWELHGIGGADYRSSNAWQEYEKNTNKVDRHSPEFEALAIFGLEPPLTLEDIKNRYKELAKKYHPDLNRGCNKSEELLKKVNMSYTILKLAFQKFDHLEKA